MERENENTLFVARNEYKYLLTAAQAARLKALLLTELTPDLYSKEGYYRVKSLYFDTLQNKDYFEKDAGEQIRNKIRLRIYDEKDTTAKLELKAKNGIFQHKYSLKVNREEAEALMRMQYVCLLDREEETAGMLYQMLVLKGYRPKAIVEYNRCALCYPLNDTRITFDSEIKGCETNLNLYEKEIPYFYAENEQVVLEVKFNGKLAPSIRKMLSGFPLVNQSFSKYCNSRRILQELI